MVSEIEYLIDGLIAELQEKRALRVHTYEKGAVIIPLGKRVETLHFLVEGSCYCKSLTDEGSEIIYETLTPQSGLQRFLELLIFYSDSQTSTTTFVAKTPCLCYGIAIKDFYVYANRHPDLLHALVSTAIKSYDSLDDKYHRRHGGKAANDLCDMIYHRMVEENGVLVAKVENHSELARHLGIHRVSVVRILKQLEDQGVLQRSTQGLIINDAPAILAYAKGKRFTYKK